MNRRAFLRRLATAVVGASFLAQELVGREPKRDTFAWAEPSGPDLWAIPADEGHWSRLPDYDGNEFVGSSLLIFKESNIARSW